uniref:Pentatricopeptide repeat-containing protein n=1 Tax=Oryza punctata TaxID=4537 RepID=A0A0E0JUE2_ORYPU
MAAAEEDGFVNRPTRTTKPIQFSSTRAGLPRALPALLRSAARCEGAGAYVGGAQGWVTSLEDGFVGTALVGAYAACGCVGDERIVFDRMAVRDVVSWGVMLDSYCQTWNYKEALLLFAKMKDSGVLPDQLILATVLSACGHIRHLRTGRAIHSYMLVSDILISTHLSSALINLYASCANMEKAEKLYNGLPRKDLVSSTAMVFGYARNRKVEIARSIFDGMPEKDPTEALSLFNGMQECGIRPDEVTMLSVISACSNLGSLDKAKWIHAFIKNNGLNKILHIGNALIDMFAKCGGINLALNIFNEMPQKNVITWTSMITASAMHVHEGRSLFSSMVQQYRIEPKHEHYGCMEGLNLCKKQLISESMHLGPNVPIWGSLLAACWMHGDLKLGAFAAKKILQLDPNHDGASVLLLKIYMKSDNLSDAQEVREVMKLQGVSKEMGLSWMELNERFHEFAAGGEKYPEHGKIFQKL